MGASSSGGSITESTQRRAASHSGPSEYRPRVMPERLCPTRAATRSPWFPARSALLMNQRRNEWKLTRALRLPATISSTPHARRYAVKRLLALNERSRNDPSLAGAGHSGKKRVLRQAASRPPDHDRSQRRMDGYVACCPLLLLRLESEGTIDDVSHLQVDDGVEPRPPSERR